MDSRVGRAFGLAVLALVALACLSGNVQGQEAPPVDPCTLPTLGQYYEGCEDAPVDVWTLYRTHLFDDSARVHVATFDNRGEGSAYNSDNCESAAELFQQQPGVTVRYWCRQGTNRLHRMLEDAGE